MEFNGVIFKRIFKFFFTNTDIIYRNLIAFTPIIM